MVVEWLVGLERVESELVLIWQGNNKEDSCDILC